MTAASAASRSWPHAIEWVAGGASFSLLAGLAAKRRDGIMSAPDGVLETEDNKWGQCIFDVTDRARWDGLIGAHGQFVSCLLNNDDNPWVQTWATPRNTFRGFFIGSLLGASAGLPLGRSSS